MVETSREELTAVVDGFVKELLTAAGWTRPPVDAVDLAQRHLGMTICQDGSQPQRGRAQRNAAGRLIYLRPEPRAERRQWTVAHEIGEHLKSQLWQRLGARPSDQLPGLGESLANLFAHRLLVPSGWFAEDARQLDYDLPALKLRYATASHEVIAWRMLDLPEPCIITVVDNNHVSRRRSNTWPITRELCPPERACQRYVHENSRARLEVAEGWTVHGWPIHQPDWRREILRSVVDDI